MDEYIFKLMGNLKTRRIYKINNRFIHKEEIIDKKNVYFQLDGKIYPLICDKNESFSSIFQRFKKKYKTDGLNLYYFKDGKELTPEMNLQQMNNNINVIVHNQSSLLGGLGPLPFTDVSKQNREEHYFSDDAPSYRIVTQGINIYGKCKGDRKCKGYEKEVIVPLKKIKSYNLTDNRDNLECPECKGYVIPKTLGFHLCEYIVKGKKINGERIEPFQFTGKADNKESVQYYIPEEKGETKFMEFIIEITKYIK